MDSLVRTPVQLPLHTNTGTAVAIGVPLLDGAA